ncbi:hypothetical protein P378_20625 [Desulforamulus profundi]|uniref:Germination protein Ger(X)C n=1 Tax=Desulforamulus profundi TaxID=1383067 RepID=A0A2C6MBY9_9FIRM|nr:Ger(x)C family spore germination protein [Desulforamulus profundi]PHJ36716.1 hypothetical protein P378_20625 [Desulforamulus profundi]
MRRKSGLLVVLLILTMVTGCWSSLALEKRAIVSGFGLDQAKEKGKVRVTLQIVKSGAGGRTDMGDTGGVKAKQSVLVYTGTGYTFSQALDTLVKKTGKSLFYSEAKIVVAGEAMAREGLFTVTDFFDRSREPSTRNLLIIAKGEAKEVLETKLGEEDIWAYGIRDVVKSAMLHGYLPTSDIKDFITAVESRTTAPVVPLVKIIPNEYKNEGNQPPEQKQAVPAKEMKLLGMAVFRHYKMVGQLDERQTRGFLWVNGKEHRCITTLPIPGSEDKKAASVTIRADSKVKPELKNGKLRIHIQVHEEGELSEIQPDSIDMTNPANVKEFEKLKQYAIAGEIQDAVKKAQGLNSDIFGFGEEVHRRYPREWNQLKDKWDEIFPLLEVTIKVQSKIRRTEKVTNPAMSE